MLIVFSFTLVSCATSANNISPLQRLKEARPQYVAVSKGRVEYYRLGQGTPIILIPGYVTDISSWNRNFIATLATQHEVIVLNNRNVGGTQINSAYYESRDLANDTFQLIQQLKLKKPTIVGISMGGMIAQQLAVLHASKLSHLVLINTAIAGEQVVLPDPQVEKVLLDMPIDKLGRYQVAVQYFFPPAWRFKMGYALAVDRFQPQQYTEIEPAKIMSQQKSLLFAWMKDDETAKKLSRLKLPVLILNGGADVVIPPVNSIILANTIPHAELMRWPEGGHAMIYQYPEELGRVINDFIVGR